MPRRAHLLLPLLWLTASTPAAEPVSETRLLEAQAFLLQYAMLSQSQSPDFFELYSDWALIHTRSEGNPNPTTFEGRAYKTWSRELLMARRIGIDASEFHEVVVAEHSGHLLLRAKRFSRAHCFWDADYQVTLVREAAGFKILDERITTARARECPVTQAVLVAEQDGVVRLAPSMPNLSEWHPLSQDEVARSAMQLAQQMAARNQDKLKSGSLALATPPIRAIKRVADPDSVLITPDAD